MAIKIRRVVTGHDAKGRAVVLADGLAPNVISQRAKLERALLWTTETLPASNDGDEDMGNLEIGIGFKGGSVFSIVKWEPGCAARVHRTLTVDYGVILSGSIFLEMDGTEVELHAGDTYILRGTVHSWDNRGTEDCVAAVTMVDAKPVKIGRKRLDIISAASGVEHE